MSTKMEFYLLQRSKLNTTFHLTKTTKRVKWQRRKFWKLSSTVSLLMANKLLKSHGSSGLITTLTSAFQLLTTTTLFECLSQSGRCTRTGPWRLRKKKLKDLPRPFAINFLIWASTSLMSMSFAIYLDSSIQTTTVPSTQMSYQLCSARSSLKFQLDI